jgi:plasmid stabilization system protein ParE
MSARYVLAPQAARDLVETWQYIRKQSRVRMADHVESTIKEKFIF